MLFNSLEFIFLFLPFVLAVSLFLKGRALLRWVALSSFAFYALAGHTWFLLPMLVTTVLDFSLAPYLAAAATRGRRKGILAFSLCCNLGLLFYFKYSLLFLGTAHSLWGGALGAHAQPQWFSHFDVILPAGISFYTFQTMAYMIDVYRGEAEPERDFWKFAGFVSFFPRLLAGPITRHHQLLPHLGRLAERGVKPRWQEGVFLFSVGLAKKVLIADRIAYFIDPMINDVARLGAAEAWLALLGYSLQVYFDFSGYCDMAIGIGRLFGIELPQNFNSPYQARNPSDFWRRWHMTLSAWLRDYLYQPLCGKDPSLARRALAVTATMFLGGLWHGADWTFAAWGLYHAALLTGSYQMRDRWRSWPVSIQMAVTFGAMMLGRVFFRAPNFADAARWFAALFGANGLGESVLAERGVLLFLVALGMLITQLPRNASSRTDWDRLSPPLQAGLGLATVAAILWANTSIKFLYFQF